MAARPPARAPLQDTPAPRGRSGIAAIGTILVAGGIALFAFVSQQQNTSTSTGQIATSRQGLKPNGDAPTNFTTYRAPDANYALYVSTTWKSTSTTILWDGAPIPAITFTPDSTKLPAWTIAFPTKPITNQSFPTNLGAMITARDKVDFQPRNGPDPATVGAKQWTHIDGIYAKSGQDYKLSAYAQPYKTGSVLVFYEDLPNLFDKDEQQNFMPMLVSLNLNG